MKTFHYCRTFPLLPLFYHLLLSPPPVCCHFVCLCTSVFDGVVDVGPYASFPQPEDDNGSRATDAASPRPRQSSSLKTVWLQWNAVCSHGWAQASTFGCRHQLARINGNKDSSNAHFNKPSQTNKRTSVSNVRTRVYKRQFSKTTT